MTMTAQDAQLFDNSSPAAQRERIGTRVKNALNGGVPFLFSAKLSSSSANTSVVLVDPSYVTGFDALGQIQIDTIRVGVNGSTAWAGALSNVIVKDSAGNAIITYPKAIFTGNNIVTAGASGVVPSATYLTGSLLSAGVGISIVADGTATQGSDIYVTITGSIVGPSI